MDWTKFIDITGNAVIPATVTEIEKDAFRNCERLKSIDIPEGVTSIGECAFFNCSELREVYLPSTLKTIGRAAFQLCDRIESIDIPEGVTRIEESTFDLSYSDHFGFRRITLPSSLTSIGKMAFKGCPDLEFLEIPNSVTEIEDNAFNDAHISFLKFPASVKAIGAKAFDAYINYISLSSSNPDDYASLVNAMTPEQMSKIIILVPHELVESYSGSALFGSFESIRDEDFERVTGRLRP